MRTLIAFGCGVLAASLIGATQAGKPAAPSPTPPSKKTAAQVSYEINADLIREATKDGPCEAQLAEAIRRLVDAQTKLGAQIVAAHNSLASAAVEYLESEGWEEGKIVARVSARNGYEYVVVRVGLRDYVFESFDVRGMAKLFWAKPSISSLEYIDDSGDEATAREGYLSYEDREKILRAAGR